MSVRKSVVERYIEGFRAGDHEMILSCLTDDVTWDMPPYFNVSGKGAFENEIENDAAPGLPDIRLTRLVEEGDIVVAEGEVQAALKAGGRIDALFCDVFHFQDDKICRLVTYQVDRHPGDVTRRAFGA
jgi:ketosteroid isomerase-like protein